MYKTTSTFPIVSLFNTQSPNTTRANSSCLTLIHIIPILPNTFKMFFKSIMVLFSVLSLLTISFASNSEVEQLSDTTPLLLRYNARLHNKMWNNSKVVTTTAPSACQAPSNVSVTTPATSPEALMATVQISWTSPNSATPSVTPIPGDAMNISIDYWSTGQDGMPNPIAGSDQFPINHNNIAFDVPNGTYIVLFMQKVCSDGSFAPVSFNGSMRSGQPNSVTQPVACQNTVTPTGTHISTIDSKTGTISFEWTSAQGVPIDAVVWANLEVNGQGSSYVAFLNSNIMTLTGLPTGVAISFAFRIYNGWDCEQSLNYYSVTVMIPPPI